MNVLDNLKERYTIKQNCESNPELQKAAIALLNKQDGIQYFFKYWLWTFDPRKSPSDLPFVPWPYQEKYIQDLHDDIGDGISQLTEKSRDMGVTWMVLGTFVYCWLVHDESFLLGSRKQELVDTIGDMDSLFERVRYMVDKLPKWMLDHFGYEPKMSGFMKLYKSNGSSIVGEAMNPDFSRGGRYKAILLDEFAFTERSQSVWRSCGDSAPCKIVVSTPNGSNNFFAQLRKSGKIKVNTVHWKQHPFKDDKWYEKQGEDRTSKDIAQELDINYTISAGDPFYQGFSRALHLRKMRISKEKELVLSWDYGFRHPNCSIHQISTEGIWIIVDNIFGEDQTIDEFGECVSEYLNQHYQGFQYRHRGFGDPAGRQSSDKSRKSSEQILNEMGFKVTSIPSNSAHAGYANRKAIIEKKLRTLIGGVPSLVINDTPNNYIIAEGFEGGYRYPDANKYGGISEKPVEDGWYEHCLSGGTKVRTLDGWHFIKDLVGKDFITYAYDSFSKRLIPAEAKNCRKTQDNVILWKLKLDIGELIATPDHLIMMRDGSYRELQNLKKDDELMPFYDKERSRSGHRILNLNDGSYVDEHRYVYNWFNGNLRQDNHIHHLDNNPRNNYPNNLQQLPAKEHMAGVYDRARKAPRKNGSLNPWNQESRDKVAKATRLRFQNERHDKICIVCNKVYSGTNRQMYCNDKCGWKSKRKKAVSVLELINHKVESIEFYGHGETYCLDVDNYHNFPANGIMVHNCMNTVEYVAVNLFRAVEQKPRPQPKADMLGKMRQEREVQNAGISY